MHRSFFFAKKLFTTNYGGRMQELLQVIILNQSCLYNKESLSSIQYMSNSILCATEKRVLSLHN